MLDADPPRPARPWRAFLRGALLAAVAVFGVESYRILLSDNVRTVLPGRLYRSASLPQDRLECLLRQRDIRSVVNLIGTCSDEDWYLGEARATAACGASLEDVRWNASRLPPPAELRQLVEVFEHADYPVLIHCKRGVDRTGLATAVALLLTTDADLAAARRELNTAHGHIPLAGTDAMDRFLDAYEQWLTRWDIAHTPAAFRHWALCEYCPGPGRGWLEPLGWPKELKTKEAVSLRLRAHNTSPQPWELKPGTQAGVHVRYAVLADTGFAGLDYAGLFRATVPPGGSVDVTLALPPLPAGHYCVAAELRNGREFSFTQVGCEPLLWEMYVRE